LPRLPGPSAPCPRRSVPLRLRWNNSRRLEPSTRTVATDYAPPSIFAATASSPLAPPLSARAPSHRFNLLVPHTVSTHASALALRGNARTSEAVGCSCARLHHPIALAHATHPLHPHASAHFPHRDTTLTRRISHSAPINVDSLCFTHSHRHFSSCTRPFALHSLPLARGGAQRNGRRQSPLLAALGLCMHCAHSHSSRPVRSAGGTLSAFHVRGITQTDALGNDADIPFKPSSWSLSGANSAPATALPRENRPSRLSSCLQSGPPRGVLAPAPTLSALELTRPACPSAVRR
jgi:hypothetical protein